MAFTGAHVKIVHGGLIFNSNQTWSVGFALRTTASSLSQADCNGLATAANVLWLADVWTTGTGIKVVVDTGATMTNTKVYWYPAGAHSAATSGFATNTSSSGTSTLKTVPQVACVVTLQTGNAGRGNRGRVYIPMVASQGLSSGRLSTTDTDLIANAVRTYIVGQNGLTQGSNTFTSIVAGGVGADITQVKVDNILDTQRRRRDKYTASYSKVVAV